VRSSRVSGIGPPRLDELMYNKDVQTRFHELSGPGSYELFSSADRIVLGVSIQQSGTSSTSEIQCNSTAFVKNYGKDFPFNEVAYRCNGAINLSKTGQDSASYIVSVIDYNKLGTNTASISGTINGDINFASRSGIALGNSMYILWLALGILIMLQAIHIGWYIFKK